MELTKLTVNTKTLKGNGETVVSSKDYVLTPLEAEWLEAVPEKFHNGAYIAYKEFLEGKKFNNNIEANKVKMAFMDAFVTAIFMTQKED